MLAVAYKGIAIPILWTFLNKKGNSNTGERIAYLTANREFRGKAWLRYLARKKIPFRLRIPNNTVMTNKPHGELPVTRLFRIKAKQVMVLREPRTIWGCSVYLAATPTLAEGEHVIVISNVVYTQPA